MTKLGGSGLALVGAMACGAIGCGDATCPAGSYDFMGRCIADDVDAGPVEGDAGARVDVGVALDADSAKCVVAAKASAACARQGGGLEARALNAALQAALNPPGELRVERFGWTFGPGDKVMQVANSYDREVFNGDLGVITGVDLEEGELTVVFDGREVAYGFGELDELVLAYATTIHKAQGSEYPAVVIPLSTQHYAMLARNLLYTGVTRGRKLVVLLGQRRALAIAVRNQGARRRWSKLREWLAL